MAAAHSGPGPGLAGSGLVLQPRDLLAEVALLLGVGGVPGCGLVGGQRGGWVPVTFEQVGADGMKSAIAAHPGVGLERAEQFEAGAGPADHADRHGVVESDDRVIV